MDSEPGYSYSHPPSQRRNSKRSHAQMEHEGSTSPSWSSIRLSVSREPSNPPPHPQVSGLTLPRPHNMTSNQPRRYPGDGFDYRRPVTLARNDTIPPPFIDLTADDVGPSSSNNGHTAARAQRPPRFSREIIDLEDDEVVHPVHVPDSPEIEFISERPIDPPRRPVVLPPPHLETIDDDDDLEITGVQALPQNNRILDLYERPPFLENIVARFARDMEQLNHGLNADFERLQARIGRIHGPAVPPRARGPRGRQQHIHVGVGFLAPNFDYEMPAFDMGYGGGQPPPPPTYDAPQPAPKGFTRSPAEDDVLICPNCEDELCTGESDQKKQVWIIKKCGHVYCGECTAYRSKSKAKAAKGKDAVGPTHVKPFKNCVVEGCEERASARSAMIQIFL